ncbi:hypothetical protein GGR42_000790 [Saonia flava]|uniref:Uncharacterized protein n=1 Tax=Saonia flava TaxID=523696 RepID=A0A846QQE5_9FLAO|nr:hypothetical protein [Saonia flava]
MNNTYFMKVMVILFVGVKLLLINEKSYKINFNA